jgi:trk system potassium uptake protein
MRIAQHPKTRHSAWLWTTALVALWLAGAAILRASFCLEPGRFLYASDALLLSTSALTGSGLSPVAFAGQFTPLGVGVLSVMMLVSALATLYISGRLALKLFPGFTPGHTPIHPSIARTGIKVILLAQVVFVTPWLLYPNQELTSGVVDSWLRWVFNAASSLSTTGWSLEPAGYLGTQFTGVGQAVLIPLLLLPALGAVPVGDAWRWATSGGRHTLHPMSRKIWTGFAVTFIAGVILITLSILTPYCYQLFHQGMESGASDTAGLSPAAAQNAFLTSTFAAGPARLGAAQPIDPGQALPGYQFLVILLSAIGLAPLSLSGGISVLALAAIARSALASFFCHASQTPDAPTSKLTRWALATLAFYLSLTLLGLFLLLLSEPYPAITLAAEATCAISGAGFSLGITGDMTGMGKGVLIALMLLGRIGPIYLALRIITQPPAQIPESPDQTR